MAAGGILLVMADVAPDREGEFDRWYDREQGPRRLEVPGILSARRYRAVYGEPRYLELYEFTDPSALKQPDFLRTCGEGPGADLRTREMWRDLRNVARAAYRHLSTRPVPEPADLSAARALMLRGLEIAPEHDDEFQDWYNTEDLPNLARVTGVLRAHRYKLDPQSVAVTGHAPTYIACYDLDRPEVQASEEWQRRNDTPWTHRMRRFYVSRLRNVYERIFPS